MVTVISLRSADFFSTTFCQSSETTYFTTNVPVLVANPYTLDSRIEELDLGYIEDGETDVANENWCENVQAEGSLIYDPLGKLRYENTQFGLTPAYNIPVLRYGNYTDQWLTFILPGQSYVRDYSVSSMEDTTDHFCVKSRKTPWGYEVATYFYRYKTSTGIGSQYGVRIHVYRISPSKEVYSGSFWIGTTFGLGQSYRDWLDSFCLEYVHHASYPWGRAILHYSSSEYQRCPYKISLPSVSVSTDWGALNYQALNSVDEFTSNGIAYGMEAAQMVKAVKDTALLLKGDVNPKTISSLYLSFKYGWSNTIRDTADLIKGIRGIKDKRSVSVTSATSVSVPYGTADSRVTIYYDPIDGVLNDCYYALRKYDLLPSLDNAWDLVPLSFVVDWVLPIGDIFDRIDKLDLVNHLNLLYGFRTTKVVREIPGTLFGQHLIGSIQTSNYSRSLTHDFDFPLFVTNNPTIQNHVVEGSTLVIQRL